MSERTAWLLEAEGEIASAFPPHFIRRRTADEARKYRSWSGDGDDPLGGHTYAADANDALQFASAKEADAYRVAHKICFCKPTEHMWPDPSTPVPFPNAAQAGRG